MSKTKTKTKTKIGVKLKNRIDIIIHNPKHILSILITAALIAVMLLCYQSSLRRVVESVQDFIDSFAYMFGLKETASVTGKSSLTVYDLHILPEDWSAFCKQLIVFGRILITGVTFKEYGVEVGNVLNYVLIFIMIALIVFLVIYIIYKVNDSENNKYNVNTKPLKIFKKITNKTYYPVKTFIKNYISFLKRKKVYLVLWALILAVCFNLVTIFIEFFAFYFYLLISLDYANLYMQVYKLILDVLVPIFNLPFILKIVVGIIVFDRVRLYLAVMKLEKIEKDDEEIIKSLPIVTLYAGSMNTKKTTSMTDAALTKEKEFRNKSLDLLIETDLKFPHFPWIEFERWLKNLMNRHQVFNLATCRRAVDELETAHKLYTALDTCKRGYIYKIPGYKIEKYKNYLFGYDYDRYGYYYNDNLTMTTIYDALRDYAQLYFIYITSTYLVASYSIRTDAQLKDSGNFPVWDTDFIKRDSAKIAKNSRHAHIIQYDALRLGKKMIEDNKFAKTAEFGVYVITEIGKERGNKNTVKGKKEDDEANQNNDLFNIDLKMCRHKATVCNYPFICFLTDEQRPENWGADAKDLCDIFYINSSTDFKISSALYSVDELAALTIKPLFDKWYTNDRNRRGDNTLTRYLLKNAVNLVWQHYVKYYNLLSVASINYTRSDGREVALQDGAKVKYKLLKKKIHSDRFCTDALGDFYYKRALTSEYGINDVPTYANTKATLDELRSQQSYFITDTNKHFDD